MRIHFVVNHHRADAVEAAQDCAAWLGGKGLEVGADSDSTRFMNLPTVAVEDFGRADLVVAFGGDGTLLRAAHLASEAGVPILGVYYGRFGFVTQCRGDAVRACIERFFARSIPVEERLMLRAELMRGGHPVAVVHSLNEVVLQRSVTARMMTFEMRIEGQLVAAYPADGIIVSTPTGSTAYNLSAGGPLLAPNVDALAITALAPHTLTARPLVVRPEAQITLCVQSQGDSVLSVDGQTRLHLLSGDEVRVSKSERVTRLISVDEDDFLSKLGRRLFFSQGMYAEGG